jgi:myo-inositol 2-dehydrogenase/D-chiro-inositol 1-dehydrogenase
VKQVAVIGAGGMGRFHAATLLGLPGIELAAVADPFPHADLDKLGVPVRTDVAACAAHGWDGVVIASPDETHAELTLTALDAGSRVLCEKPLSDDLAGARAVIDKEASIGERRVQVGFMRVVDPAHVALADQLAALGDLHYLRCSHRNTNEVARPAGVVIVQSLIHDIHTVHWLAGRVVDVDARLMPRPGGLTHVLLVLRLASGATATIEFSDDSYAYEVEVEATAANGMVTTSAPQRPRLRIDGDHRTPIGLDWFGWFADAYRIQDRRWVASLDDPEASGPSALDGLAAQLVAEAGLTSLTQGGPVAVQPHDTPEVYTI